MEQVKLHYPEHSLSFSASFMMDLLLVLLILTSGFVSASGLPDTKDIGA